MSSCDLLTFLSVIRLKRLATAIKMDCCENCCRRSFPLRMKFNRSDLLKEQCLGFSVTGTDCVLHDNRIILRYVFFGCGSHSLAKCPFYNESLQIQELDSESIHSVSTRLSLFIHSQLCRVADVPVALESIYVFVCYCGLCKKIIINSSVLCPSPPSKIETDCKLRLRRADNAEFNSTTAVSIDNEVNNAWTLLSMLN